MQLLENGKVINRDISYSEIDKLSGKDGGKVGKVIGYSALGVLAGVGILTLVMVAVYANH